MHGTYIGEEEQFKGRSANLEQLDEGAVAAQFDKGKLWETHSRLLFPKKDWCIDEE